MKKKLFIASIITIISIIITSCTSSSTKLAESQLDAKSKIEKLLKNQSPNQKPALPLFLNFKIGSNRREVLELIKAMAEEKTITVDKRGTISYDFNLKDSSLPIIQFSLIFDYYKDMLCRVKATAMAPWDKKEIDGNYMTEKFKKFLLARYPTVNFVDLPNSGTNGIALVSGKQLIELENDIIGISVSQYDPAMLKSSLKEDPTLNPTAITKEEFLDEINHNGAILDATITDANFLYIAIQNDNKSKDAMATYYCKLAQSKGIFLSGVKIIDATTFKKQTGAALGIEIGRAFCK